MKRFFVVKQAGIANVFRVKAFNLTDYGRDAERIYQGDFRGAIMLGRGAELAGATVKVASCDKAGDIVRDNWLALGGAFEEQFREHGIPKSWEA